jgi:hypothetical protein
MESEEKPKENEPETTEEAAPLNRAERRALARKKGQGNTSGGSGMRGGTNAHGTGRTSSQAGNVRLPRTGHK